MEAQTATARVICYMTAASIDRAKRESDAAARKRAGERALCQRRSTKAYSTDIGDEVASIGVQVHGGMGFIEETGAAQFVRDVRIGGDLRRHERHPGDRSSCSAGKIPLSSSRTLP